MKTFFRFTVVFIALIFLASCGDDDSDSGNSNTLTGKWRSESNNTLYSVTDNNTSVEFDMCNDQPAFNLIKNNEFLSMGSNNLFQILSDSELEFVSGGLSGIKLSKISSDPGFNNGSIIIESDNLENININSNLCAYRDSDNQYLNIGIPYINSFMAITIFIEDVNASGNLDFNSDILIQLESSEFSDGIISSTSGTANISEYTSSNLKANFEFLDSVGNSYSGSLDISF